METPNQHGNAEIQHTKIYKNVKNCLVCKKQPEWSENQRFDFEYKYIKTGWKYNIDHPGDCNFYKQEILLETRLFQIVWGCPCFEPFVVSQ